MVASVLMVSAGDGRAANGCAAYRLPNGSLAPSDWCLGPPPAGHMSPPADDEAELDEAQVPRLTRICFTPSQSSCSLRVPAPAHLGCYCGSVNGVTR